MSDRYDPDELDPAPEPEPRPRTPGSDVEHMLRRLHELVSSARPMWKAVVACITAVAWPFFAMLGILAEPLIRILFGEKWLESVPVLRILCVHAILVYTTLLVDQIVFLSGETRMPCAGARRSGSPRRP